MGKGNVLATITDQKEPVDVYSDDYVHYWLPRVFTDTDYYPLGMQMPGRTVKYTLQVRRVWRIFAHWYFQVGMLFFIRPIISVPQVFFFLDKTKNVNCIF